VHLHRSLALTAVLAAGVCAPGCGRHQGAPPPPVVLRIGLGTPPGAPNTGSGGLINLLKADTWLSTKPDGQPGPRIVTDWKWDEAGTELRLKLRTDVVFHDGTPLTPETAAAALRDPSIPDNSLKSIASITPEGTDTLVLKLTEHNAFLLADLGSIFVVKAGDPDVGTGPYQIVGRKEQDATLTAFPRYYHGRPALAGVDVTKYKTQRNAWTAMMRGDIDMLYEVSRDSSDLVQSETSVHTYSFPRPYYIELVFSMRNSALHNVDVRRAINEALDREALIRDGMRGQGVRADGPLLPQHWSYTPPVQPYAYDPAAARRRLDAAGYPLKPDAVRRTPVRLSFKCMVFGNDTRFERLVAIAQKELSEVGIDMQLEPLPSDVMIQRIGSGDFDAYLFEMSGQRLSRVYDFWRSGKPSMNNTGYRAADDVLDRIRTARNDEGTRESVADLMRVMHDDPPAAFIAWQRSMRAVSTRFDVAPEPDRDILTSLWLWRPAPGQQRPIP
jgi:peptide/nickel transport system substrate-binding protein